MQLLQSNGIKAIMVAVLLTGLVAGSRAQAAPKGDSFALPRAAAPRVQDPEAIVRWFESIDDAVAKYRPTPADEVILGRPMNQEAERVRQWIVTADKVAKSYRQLAKTVMSLALPLNNNELKSYRSLTADWYSDAALIYEDLIRPCAPYRTQEEMLESLHRLTTRADGLAQTRSNLRVMDQKLRLAYQVHPPRHDDMLQQYVSAR